METLIALIPLLFWILFFGSIIFFISKKMKKSRKELVDIIEELERKTGDR